MNAALSGKIMFTSNAELSGKRKFVVAFNRDRDGYQVALALHAASMLEALVTDFYAPDSPPGRWLTPQRLRHRRVPGLPSTLVHSSLRALLLQIYHEKRQAGGDGWFMQVDAILARKAAQIAAESSADLLLYSQYALEAFADARLSNRYKGLFFYHPHPSLGREILLKDFEKFPECVWSVNNATEMVNTDLQARIDAECALADFFICASSFTRRSLIFHGVPAARIAVAPYGAKPVTSVGRVERSASTTRFLFVGQGLQRKGLHHLLRAWKAAQLGNATLRVICSRLDPGFQPLLDQPNVDYSPAVSRTEILDAFAASHIFVMPSLVEGFGLVYLEALASGCSLIATPNTGVPDLGLPEDMAILVEPGNIDELTAALRRADSHRSAGLIDHAAIVRFADSLSLEGFRRRVVSRLDDAFLQAAHAH